MPPCRQAAATSALDAQLAQGFQASDPPSRTQPAGDPSHATVWDCSIEVEPEPARSAGLQGYPGDRYGTGS